jgi:hypothetical protein
VHLSGGSRRADQRSLDRGRACLDAHCGSSSPARSARIDSSSASRARE